MGLETHVMLRMECDDWYPIEDTLSIIRGEQPFSDETEPHFSVPVENKEDWYTGNGSVRRSCFQRKKKNVYVMKIFGETHHLSVVDWFKDSNESRGRGFFLKVIDSFPGNEWKITCESNGVENLDNHEITLTYDGKKIELVIDGKKLKNNKTL